MRVEFVDPSDSDDAKREAKERFGIDPTPLRFANKNEKSVVNAYFAIAIQYGDQHAVLGLDDLITVRVLDVGDVDITLRNLEYQLTKTIKKTVAEFSSIDTLFASTAGKIKLTAYMTPKTLPDNWKDAPQKLQKAVADLQKQAGGKLEFTTVEPKTEAEMQQLFDKYGLRPYQDLLGGQVYYFHLLLQVGDRIVRIVPPQNLGEADLETSLTEGLKRAAPGFTRVVGLWQPPPGGMVPPMQGAPPQQMPPPQSFHTLEKALSGSYEVRGVTLETPVPDDIEALVLAGPADLDAKAARNLDQFVMRGGALVALDGHFRLAPSEGLAVEKVKTGLERTFAKWGITVGDELVMDTKSDSFPVPENRQVGNGLVVRELHQIAYPYFVKVDGDQLASGSVITGGLAGSVMHWATPVEAEAKVGKDTHHVEPLLRSSSGAWLSASTNVQPNFATYPDTGFATSKDVAADKHGVQTLAVAVTGGFASAVATPQDAKPTQRASSRGTPEATGSGAATGSGVATGSGGTTGSATAPATGSGATSPPGAAKDAPRLLEHSPPDTRIVVFGSSAFVSDGVLGLAQQLDSDLATSNVELVHNAVDWSLADTDLLSIRSRDAASRALTIGPEARGRWRIANVAIGFAGLVLVVGAVWLRRRAVAPLEVS